MYRNSLTFFKYFRNIGVLSNRVPIVYFYYLNLSYEKIITDKVTYDLSKKIIGKIKKEDYLRNRLVDDYLENELGLFEDCTDLFTVNKEVSEEHKGLIDEELHNDPIDIHIVDSALKKSLGAVGKIYFAIECKRIKSGISEYVKDTQKFTERNYSKLRLSFEGQLGFVENSSLTHSNLKDKINQNLSSNSDIEAVKKLENHIIKNGFDASYLSEHKKKDKSSFSVFHLFLNYSEIILN